MRPPAAIDVRLAVPVAVGWLALVLALPEPAAPGRTALVAGLLAVAALAGGAVLARRRGTTRPSSPSSSLSPSPSSGASTPVAAAAVIGLTAAVVALLTAGAAARHDARWPPELAALEGRVAVVTGTASERMTVGTTAAELVLEEARVGDDLVWQGSSTMLLLGPRPADGRVVEIGQHLTARVSVLPVDHGADVAFVGAVRGEVEPGAPPEGLAEAANAVRGSFREVTATLPGDGGALLPGLTLGDTSAVPDDLREAMATASLTHLTAVSGSNCAVLVALTMIVAGLLRVPRLARLGAAVVVLLAFLVLVTPDASILRATVMALVVLAHLGAARPVSGLPVVAVAVLGLLVADPWLARDVGFALSVLATTGLVVLAGPLATLLGRVLPAPLALVLAVPVAAQLACQPVLLLLEPSIPVHGVTANVLVEPAAPLATVGGLVVCATAGWAPGVALAVARVAWVPATWVGAVARSVETWPFARLPWPDAPAAAAALVLVTVVAAGAVLGTRGGRARVVLGATSGLLVLTLVAVVAGVRTGERAAVPDGWTVAQCDVGQGDAVLVRSAGATALVDVGDDAEALAGCLRRFAVAHVDLLVLTHFDADHVGAVDVVADDVDRALVGPVGRPADADVVERLRRAGAEVVEATAGVGGVLGDLSWTALWPPPASDRGAAVEPGNDASVVTAWQPRDGCATGCMSLLDLGDLGEAAQRRLLAAGGVPTGVDVVKVSHHGSADQLDALYEAARPRVGLVGVGADNTYGHPTEDALGLLVGLGTEVVRTDRDGDAAVRLDDEGMHVWREHPPAAAGASAASATLVPVALRAAAPGGGPWRRARPARRPRRRPSASTRSPGTRSAPPPSCS